MDALEDEDDDDEMGVDEEAKKDGDQEGEGLPVMWHMTLLTLVQVYRPYLTPTNCLKLKALVKVQYHGAVSPDIRKCLASDYLEKQLATQQMAVQ